MNKKLFSHSRYLGSCYGSHLPDAKSPLKALPMLGPKILADSVPFETKQLLFQSFSKG